MHSTNTPTHQEFFIVVDVETSGPNPSNYALLSIGACTLDNLRQTFYIELKPDTKNFTAEAMQISKLSLEKLTQEGADPETALQSLEQWLETVVPKNHEPVFTAFNAPFDWMFINDYFYRYLNRNPFGHKALDIKALYMGMKHTTWADTSYKNVVKVEGFKSELSHHALDDAIQTAKLFQKLLDQIRRNKDDFREKGRTAADH